MNLKQQLIQEFGSVSALARALEYSRQAVYQWGDDVPDSALDRLARLQPEVYQRLVINRGA